MAGVGEKHLIKLSPSLTDDAQYKNFADIDSWQLNIGSTIQLFPGTYEVGTIALDGVHVQGIGNRAGVILANANLSASTANVVHFSGVTFRGNSAVTTSSARGIFIAAATPAATTLKFTDCAFENAEFGIDNQGLTTLVVDRCDFSQVDKAIRSNAVVSANVAFTQLNSSSNAYFTGANATLKAVQVKSAYSGGSNTGNTLETVSALVS